MHQSVQRESWKMMMSAIVPLLLSILFCKTRAAQIGRPSSESLIIPERVEQEANNGEPVAPFWVKVDKMEQRVFAEPLNSLVRLKCTAGGHPNPNITWYKNGIPIQELSRPAHLSPYKERPDQYVLRIPSLVKFDEGNYTCVVSNDYGSLSHSYRVEALELYQHKPVLVDISENITLLAGMTATFFCDFKSDLAMVTLWMRLDNSSAGGYRSIVDAKNQTIDSSTIVIDAVGPEDAGMYYCLGKTQSEFTIGFLHLTVLSLDESLLERPQNVTAQVGEDATFTCRTHLDLHKYTYWARITENELVNVANGTEVLKITNVTFEDAGSYACIIGSKASDWVCQETVHLEVIDSMVATAKFTSFHITAGVIGCAVAVVLVVVSLILLKACHNERKQRKKVELERNWAEQWIKKVIIEKAPSADDPDSPVVAPLVIIRKESWKKNNCAKRSRLASENTTCTTVSEYDVQLDPKWEIPRVSLRLGEALGEGAFGRVVKAEVFNLAQSREKTVVAVKMLKEGHTDSELISFISELEIMKMIGTHVNIINLLGTCTQDGPVLGVVEFAEHGNLRDYLRKFIVHQHNDGYEKPNSMSNSILVRQLISFARQVCKGMEFLGTKKCIHRDLAARNILIAKDFVVKIADFGLARDLDGQDYYKKLTDGRLPLKWMAPETVFHRHYSVKSDVWSFGVLLWEIMTLGAQPYPSVSVVDNVFQLLKKGYRMECPPNCHTDVYTIMLRAWAQDPNHRPDFTQLIVELDQFVQKENVGSDYLDMSLPLPDGSLDGNSGETIVCNHMGQVHSLDRNSNRNNSLCSSFDKGPSSGSSLVSSPAQSVTYSMHSNPYQNTSSPPYVLRGFPSSAAAPTPRPPSITPSLSACSSSSGNRTNCSGNSDTNCSSTVTYTALLPTLASSVHQSECVGHAAPTSTPFLPVSTLTYASNLQYCDDLCTPMDDMTIDEYREHYAEHFTTSAF